MTMQLSAPDRIRIAKAAVSAVQRAQRIPDLTGAQRFDFACTAALAAIKADGPPSPDVVARVAKGSPDCDCDIRVQQLLRGLLAAAIEAAYQALKGPRPTK